MKIATILFTYAREYHTHMTLEALSHNTVLPEKLYIFQDGKKDSTSCIKWEKVRNMISNINWCSTEVIVSEQNKGLAASIVTGVNRAFEENDAVIVLEDDCVPHPMFMKYATDCLNKYKDDRRVFSINGYSWPVEVAENGTDAYFAGRAGSWGWATWKDRWELYEQDYLILNSIKRDEYTNKQFVIWGQDLENHLKGNIDGRCNSWAVFWSLQCIKQRGFCPTPYQSLIHNIGHDGSGVHCGKVENMIENTREWNKLDDINLPERVEFPENYAEAYSERFRCVPTSTKFKCYNEMLVKWNLLLQNGVSLKRYFETRNIRRVAVWGKGNIYNLLKQELRGVVDIVCIVVSEPNEEEYEGIPIIRYDAIPKSVHAVIVIPVYDMDRIRHKTRNMESLIGLDEILDILLMDVDKH